jgi:hypothetical protein
VLHPFLVQVLVLHPFLVQELVLLLEQVPALVVVVILELLQYPLRLQLLGLLI